ncbi:YitT family protein [Kitasatospora sp. NPDC093550]|uniref:membrane protein YczE n=1 Tax=Kitasatospora sp. NPDC093550 TaxID=3364089 RepID=UPI00382B6C1F
MPVSTAPPRRPSTGGLGYLSLAERPLHRLARLFGGLALYGFSLSLLVRAALGVNPWSVLYQGVQRHSSLSFGTISAVVGVLVLLAWVPLRQRPTLGTGANVVVLALSSDFGLAVLPEDLGLPARGCLLLLGVLLNGFSVAVYVGARFGPGPRDGLMTGLAALTGRSLRTVRTGLEVTVLAAGWLLGGTVGVGTVAYALLVGPVTQFFLPRWTYRERGPAGNPGHRRWAPFGGGRRPDQVPRSESPVTFRHEREVWARGGQVRGCEGTGSFTNIDSSP